MKTQWEKGLNPDFTYLSHLAAAHDLVNNRSASYQLLTALAVLRACEHHVGRRGVLRGTVFELAELGLRSEVMRVFVPSVGATAKAPRWSC